MPKDSSKPDRAKPRFITMEHNTSRGQHFLCNPLIVQVRHHAVPATIVQTKKGDVADLVRADPGCVPWVPRRPSLRRAIS